MHLSANNNKINPVEVALFIASFLLFRLFLIVSLYILTNGQELASDNVFHEIIINNPLGILNGTAIHIASYPPLQWIIEWPLFNLFSLHFSEMISYRLMMCTIEFVSFLVLIKICRLSGLKKMMKMAILIFFIVSPHQYFSSVFFIQEDVIAQLFMLIALAFILEKKRMLCIFVLVMGVLSAKLFFVIPLFYIVIFQGNHKFINRVFHGISALIPLIIIYCISIINALNNGGEVPIRDFTPDAAYAANYWVILLNMYPDSLTLFKNISVYISALVQLLLFSVLLFISSKRTVSWSPTILLTIPLGFFFGTFYQHMPEYLLMLWPAAALLCTAVWHQVIIVSALSFAWAPRIFHGLVTVTENFGTAAEARNEVIGPLINMVSFDFAYLNHVALVLQSIFYFMLLVWLCTLSWNAQINNKQQ